MSYDPELRRPTPLAIRLADDIRRGGPMPVDAYMSRCLWDPADGYYATRAPIGRAGDFITAPQISQTFGELVGLWAAVVWRDVLGAPPAFTFAELGPGQGTLMADALRATARVPGFHAAMRCRLIEASPVLIAQQRQALAAVPVPVSWAGDVGSIAGPAIIVANEFFDALPVRQMTWTGGRWAERAVGVDEGGRLQFTSLPPVGPAATPAAAPPDPEAGAIIEALAANHEMTAIGAAARSGPVAALVIDYGHERSAVGDTLQAVRAHRHEHPLTSPGEADLSAQVDFEALAAAARSAGLAVDGPVSQGEFLGRLGIVERASRLMAANPARAGDIELAVARLIAPTGMGARFKAIGLRSPALAPLPGLVPDPPARS